MNRANSIWRTEDHRRCFLLPDAFVAPPGPLHLRDLTGKEMSVNPDSVSCFELTDDQARRWARAELGDTLDQLKSGLETTLARWRQDLEALRQRPATESWQITQSTAPALLDFLKALPSVIGKSLSGDEQRLDAARETMASLQQRLRDAGIDVDDRVKGFADRLASIRTDIEAEKRASDAADEDRRAPDDKP